MEEKQLLNTTLTLKLHTVLQIITSPKATEDLVINKFSSFFFFWFK